VSPAVWGWILSAATALLVTAAPAQDGHLATVDALPGDVLSVTSAGRWHTGDAAGFYRVVVLGGGYEHVVNRLYLQWLRDGDSEGPARVVKTTGVSELNTEGPYSFACHVRSARANELVVAVRATHAYTGERVRFTVRAGAPGVYRAARERPAPRR